MVKILYAIKLDKGCQKYLPVLKIFGISKMSYWWWNIPVNSTYKGYNRYLPI